jgi:DNA-binding CsgD family transcriptional regulator/PAS domain-containing protein
MISLEAFSELLQIVYSAPIHPEQWSHFLTRLCDLTGSRSGFLICADSRVNLSIQAQGGVPLDLSILQNYAENYAPTDPFRLPMIRGGKSGVLDCETLVPSAELLKSEMYLHLNEPAGYRFPTLVLLTCTVRRLEAISIWRTPDEGPMDGEGARLLDMLVPHIQAALEIRHALGVTRQQLADAELMADASATASLLLTPQGEILHCNNAARLLLQVGDGLCEAHGMLRAAEPKCREPLRKLLLQAVSSPFAQIGSQFGMLPQRAMSLNRTSALRPLQLMVSPGPSDRSGNEETVLLLVTDPEKPVQLQDDLLRGHYGFTPAETEIANGLLTGFSLEEIAALRRVSAGTVRHQLKSMFSKTGTARQSDMVRLLVNLPQPPQI